MTTDAHTTDPRDRNPEQIEAEVEATRARLTNTLDAVQDRMAPGPLFEEFLAFARARGGRDMASSVAREARDNPLPFLLIGAGVAWLALGRRGASRPVVREPYRAAAPLAAPPADAYADDPYLRDQSRERFESSGAQRESVGAARDPSAISIKLGDVEPPAGRTGV